jgi:predicted transcriptional regulator YdeE
MNTKSIDHFYVMGIAVRTTNEHGKSMIDIPKLWEQFFSENIMDKIPNKINNTLYCVYTDYEGDYTMPYTTLLGCKVSNLDSMPNGLLGKSIGGGQYSVFTAKGRITDGIVYEEWLKIWASGMNRAYSRF